MLIDSIQNGIVIDHITAGKAMELYQILGLDKLACTVAILKNVTSGKLFGIIGIIFFIPLTAVILELVKEDACRRLRTKEEQQ